MNQLAEINAQHVTTIATLEAKCAALAAENAGLKQAESNLVRNIINDLGDTEFQYARVQTPATDSYLAEMRAQGVEMFAALLTEMDISCTERGALTFATQLRQEAAQ